MAYYFPEGTQFYFSSTLGTAKTVSAITNANPAVATSTAHGFANNDELLLLSSWEDANNMVVKAGSVAANTLNLTGLDTSNTNYFSAAGYGSPTLQLVSAWQAIPQVLDVSTSGGDARFTTISPLAARNDINVPTGFNAMSINVSMGHDPANATYQTLVGLSRGLSKVAFKLVIAGGGLGYGYGYINVSELPQLSRNSPNKVSAAFTLLGRYVGY